MDFLRLSTYVSDALLLVGDYLVIAGTCLFYAVQRDRRREANGEHPARSCANFFSK